MSVFRCIGTIKGISFLSPHYPTKKKGSFLHKYKESHTPKSIKRIPNIDPVSYQLSADNYTPALPSMQTFGSQDSFRLWSLGLWG